jgi:hypothetical protein
MLKNWGASERLGVEFFIFAGCLQSGGGKLGIVE